MRAVVIGGENGRDAYSEATLDKPTLKENDVLVKIKAAAMNPVDFKIKMGGADEPKVLGWDGVGTVTEVGTAVQNLKVGDEVMFSGDVTRNGTNAEMIAVDSRVCAVKPKSLSASAAAALPLVSITAWELLFENLLLPTDGSASDLVFMMLNGAGGVGSAAIQIAKHVLGCKTVIATASRPETEEWCKNLGATHVINHHKDLGEELKRVGLGKVDICFCGIDLDKAFDQIVDVMNVDGKIGAITVDDSSKIDVKKLFFPNRITLSFEFMFARPMFNRQPELQGQLLTEIAKLVDEGKFKSIMNTELKGLSLDNIQKAHDLQVSGKCIGKIVINYE